MARLLLIDYIIRQEIPVKENTKNRAADKLLITIPENETFIEKFHINTNLFWKLYDDLIPLMPYPKSTKAVDPTAKLLAVMAFYGSGLRQQEIGKELSFAQQTLSKAIRSVTEALTNPVILKKYIGFPKTKRERDQIRYRFYEESKIPTVCGCIDSFHVRITRQHNFEEGFINSMKLTSINVQLVCDANFRILDVDVHGGATDDADIWENSDLKKYIESLVSTGEETILIGDSSYRLSNCLMTPVLGKVSKSSPEYKYNKYHKRAFYAIKHTIELFKARWRCMMSIRDLNYSPEMAAKVVFACAVLHNMCIEEEGLMPIEMTEDERKEDYKRQPKPKIPVPGSSEEGEELRKTIIGIVNGQTRKRKRSTSA